VAAPRGFAGGEKTLAGMLAEYNRITGSNDTNPNAIHEHVITRYGQPCAQCGKVLKNADSQRLSRVRCATRTWPVDATTRRPALRYRRLAPPRVWPCTRPGTVSTMWTLRFHRIVSRFPGGAETCASSKPRTGIRRPCEHIGGAGHRLSGERPRFRSGTSLSNSPRKRGRAGCWSLPCTNGEGTESSTVAGITGF
jgi:hypothetical protein